MIRFRRRAKHDKGLAEAALTNAKSTLRDIRNRTPEIQAVSGSLRELRERNHFAERLIYIMKGHQ